MKKTIIGASLIVAMFTLNSIAATLGGNLFSGSGSKIRAYHYVYDALRNQPYVELQLENGTWYLMTSWDASSGVVESEEKVKTTLAQVMFAYSNGLSVRFAITNCEVMWGSQTFSGIEVLNN